MDPALILFGLGIGVLVGLTGMGGGSLMTPLLILVFGIKPVVAVGTDLSYAAVTKTVGGWRHLKTGIVHRRMALWLAAGSCPGSLGGVYVLDQLHDAYGADFDDVVIVLIACALLLTGLLVLLRSLALTDDRRERDGLKMDTRHKVWAVLLGLSVGFVLGVTSAGSGTLIAVGLIVGFRLKPHAVVGTDIVHAALLLWVASLAHLVSGNVDLALAGTILIGSIPGVWIGSSLAARVPDSGLRPTLAIVLIASGMALLSKAGLAVPVAVLVGVPIAVAIAAVLVARSRGGARVRA